MLVGLWEGEKVVMLSIGVTLWLVTVIWQQYHTKNNSDANLQRATARWSYRNTSTLIIDIGSTSVSNSEELEQAATIIHTRPGDPDQSETVCAITTDAASPGAYFDS